MAMIGTMDNSVNKVRDDALRSHRFALNSFTEKTITFMIFLYRDDMNSCAGFM
jgi:hypothetical protein